MKNFLKTMITALCLSLVSVTVSIAGSGHSHAASKDKVERNALVSLRGFVDEGKIAKSWRKAIVQNIEKKDKEWIVSFYNSKEKVAAKQVLTMYLTSYGKLKGANYKGSK